MALEFVEYITEAEYTTVTNGTTTLDEIRNASDFIKYASSPNIIVDEPDVANYSSNLKKAVCWQIKFWQDNGNIDEVAGIFSSGGLGSLSININGDSLKNKNYLNLCEKSRHYLFQEGLLSRVLC